jgi:hypothetical protein
MDVLQLQTQPSVGLFLRSRAGMAVTPYGTALAESAPDLLDRGIPWLVWGTPQAVCSSLIRRLWSQRSGQLRRARWFTSTGVATAYGQLVSAGSPGGDSNPAISRIAYVLVLLTAPVSGGGGMRG